MAAATTNRDGQRQPSDLCPYTGSSGYTYYKNCMTMVDSAGLIQPLAQGAGASQGRFLGINETSVNLSSPGTSSAVLNIWKTGEFTLAANGTGASTDIGKRAYGLDDQTVGVSIGNACLYVGEIVGVPTTSTYRVRIDNAVNQPFVMYGVSLAVENLIKPF